MNREKIQDYNNAGESNNTLLDKVENLSELSKKYLMDVMTDKGLSLRNAIKEAQAYDEFLGFDEELKKFFTKFKLENPNMNYFDLIRNGLIVYREFSEASDLNEINELKRVNGF